MIDKKETIICNHCGNRVNYEQIDSIREMENQSEYHENFLWTVVLKCNICSKFSIRMMSDSYKEGVEDDIIRLTMDDWWEVYPSNVNYRDLLPRKIEDQLKQLKKLRGYSPEHYLHTSRKILEFILEDKGYKEDNLSRSIESFCRDEVLPEQTKRIMHLLRKIANFSVHEPGDKRAFSKAADLVEYYLNSILNTVYLEADNIIQGDKFLETMKTSESAKSNR